MPHRVVFVDTNCLLHFQWLAHIDWTNLLEASSVEVILAPVIVGELDNHKYGPSKKRRERARTILREIDEALGERMEGPLRPGVQLRCQSIEPSLDFAEYGLSREVADDRLIASIIDFCAKYPEADVALVTDDTGPRRKAIERNIKAIRLPETYRLPDEPDPMEQKLHRLQQELEHWKHRTPDLAVVFVGGVSHENFKVLEPLPAVMPEMDVAARLEVLRNKYPPYSQHHVTGIAALSVYQPTDGEVDRYNRELTNFFTASEKYWREWPAYENYTRRALRLDLVLRNVGTAPAEDIRVILDVPDGLRVYAAEDCPAIPEHPSPPPRPQALHELLMGSMDFGALALRTPENKPPPNVSPPSIRRTGSFEVRFTVEKIIQHLDEGLGPLYLVFESFGAAASFRIRWRVHSASLPHPVDGQLHVIVER